MRKLSSVLVLFMLMFLLTGCVKFNANMDIKKDKSMDFSIIYAVDTSLLGDEPLINDEEKKDLEEQGYKITDYSEDKMKGFKLVREFDNIDKISSTEDTEYSLSGILDTEKENENTNIFKVKKGLFKNTYIANFKFDASDSELNDDEEETLDYEDYEEDEDYEDYEEEDYEEENLLEDLENYDWSIFENEDDSETSISDFNDVATMATSMELSFNVTLPYPAKSNNASSTNNDNKELKWDLSSEENEDIKFEFELYNMNTIYCCVGIAILIVVAIVVVAVNKGKKNNANKTDSVETTDQTM